MHNTVIKVSVVLLGACLIVGFFAALKAITKAPEYDLPASVITQEPSDDGDTNAVSPENNMEQYLIKVPVKPPVFPRRDIICDFGCDGNFTITSEPDYQIVYREVPIMPENAERSGHCIFDLEVSIGGKVSNISNMECSDRVFELASTNSAKKWLFRPRIVSGKPESFIAKKLKIKYHLLDEEGRLISENANEN